MILAQVSGMNFSWDFNTATLLGIGTQIVILIVFLVKTNGKANEALKCAEAAQVDIEKLATQVAALTGNLSLLREQVAREHPDHDALAAMEKRLTREIHRLADRLDKPARKSTDDDD